MGDTVSHARSIANTKLDNFNVASCLLRIGKSCGNVARTRSKTGGRALTQSERRWSVGQILLLLLGVSLFLWGAIAKIAIVVLRMMQGPVG